MQNILDNESYRTQNTVVPTLDIASLLLPKAHASTNVAHSGYLYAEPNSCDYGLCKISDYKYAVDPFDLSIDSPDGGHSYGSLHVYASTCTTTSGASTKVTGTIDTGNTQAIYKTGGSCATSDYYYIVNPNPSTSYVWAVTTTHSAWT